MSEKIDGRTKEGRALKLKAVKKRLTRAQKPPFRLMIGRVNAAGSRFVFDKAVDFRTSNEIMAAAQKTIDKNDD